MSDLVAQHAGELSFGVEVRQDAARHVDEAAGEREGVDGRIVEDAERPRKVGTLGHGRQLEPQVRHVALQVGVVHQTQLGADLRIGLPPHRDLLRLADER